MLENFSRSWYDALETQVRTQFGARGSLQASYTLSRSYLDGVDFFLTMRGTQRTPRERGYNPSDQRHNLDDRGHVAPAVGGRDQRHPEARQRRADQGAGGHGARRRRDAAGDLPAGVPITVGREPRGRVARGDQQVPRRTEARAAADRAIGPGSGSLSLTRRSDARRRCGSAASGSTSWWRPSVLSQSCEFPHEREREHEHGRHFCSVSAARDARQIQWGVRFQIFSGRFQKRLCVRF